jgi:hypothetical protein
VCRKTADAGTLKGFPNQTGSKFTNERVSGQETRNLEKASVQRPGLVLARKKILITNSTTLPLKLPSLLPEPEGPAATTRHNLRGQKVPTSDSAQQPELTSSLSAGAHGISGPRRK